jgi:hypothetical protein
MDINNVRLTAHLSAHLSTSITVRLGQRCSLSLLLRKAAFKLEGSPTQGTYPVEFVKSVALVIREGSMRHAKPVTSSSWLNLWGVLNSAAKPGFVRSTPPDN